MLVMLRIAEMILHPMMRYVPTVTHLDGKKVTSSAARVATHLQ